MKAESICDIKIRKKIDASCFVSFEAASANRNVYLMNTNNANQTVMHSILILHRLLEEKNILRLLLIGKCCNVIIYLQDHEF